MFTILYYNVVELKTDYPIVCICHSHDSLVAGSDEGRVVLWTGPLMDTKSPPQHFQLDMQDSVNVICPRSSDTW